MLEKSPSPWFAGGPNPTSADFMMLYPMEVLASPRWSNSENVAGRITTWVENVHSRPQFKRVRLFLESMGIDHSTNCDVSGVGEGWSLCACVELECDGCNILGNSLEWSGRNEL